MSYDILNNEISLTTHDDVSLNMAYWNQKNLCVEEKIVSFYKFLWRRIVLNI